MEPAKDRIRSRTNKVTATFNCLIVSPCSWSNTKSSLASSSSGLRVYSANAAAGFGSTENCNDMAFCYCNNLFTIFFPSHSSEFSK